MKPSQISNPYARLGISINASTSDIRRAYRINANRWHYDRSPENKEEFIAICEAYQAIKDEFSARGRLVEDLLKIMFQIRMFGGNRK